MRDLPLLLLLFLLAGCEQPAASQPIKTIPPAKAAAGVSVEAVTKPPALQPATTTVPGTPPGIPREALIYRRTIIREAEYYWGLSAPTPLFFGQLHQESRFKATAASKYASGLAQFTPQTAAGMQAQYPDLRVMCTDANGCALDPGWAIKAMMLYDRALYKNRAFAAEAERRAFMLADYNGGAGWINRERNFCLISKECEPNIYFFHVQRACGKSSPARADWACKENNHYPSVILKTWAPLYATWLGR